SLTIITLCSMICIFALSFHSVMQRPPISPLFPYTTLFRSIAPFTVVLPAPPTVRRLPELSTVPFNVRTPVERLLTTSPQSSHRRDRKSTRLNSSHVEISYAVFCLKKKK